MADCPSAGCTAQQPKPPVILGVVRSRGDSARGSVTLLPPFAMLACWAGKAEVAHVAVGMLLFLLTLYGPTARVCGAGGLGLCPAALEHLYWFPVCTAVGSQCWLCGANPDGCWTQWRFGALGAGF